MNKKGLTLFCGVLAGCLLFAGCSAKPPAAQSDEPPIRIALTQDILSFDPMQTSDIFSEAILRCVYTSLFDLDSDLNLRPKLVKTVTVLDELSWQLEIYDNVKFHDGSPLTTDDVVFSIERAMQGGRTQKMLEVVDRVEKVDATSFRLYAKEPYPDLLTLFAKAETSIVSKKAVEAPGYDFSQPVGAGPFKLLSREENSLVRLERFDDYYKEPAATACLDFVVLVTEQERTAAFLNGDVDMLFSVSAYDCDKLKLSPDVQVLQAPSTKIEYLSLNNLKPPLDDPRVRQAVSYAIDREKLTKSVYHGYSTPSSSLIPEGIIGYLPDQITYDPDKARQLLKEAGLEQGFEFTVITIDTIRKNTLEYIKLDLAEVGITLNYDLVTMKDAAAMMMAGKHQGILVGWAYNPDPNGVLPLLLGTGSGKSMNSSNYSNPEFDRLLVTARAEADPDTKRGLYEQINQMVTQDSPIVVLLNPMILCAAKTHIAGIHLNAQGLFQYEALYRT